MDTTLPHPPATPPLILRAARDRSERARNAVPLMPGVALLPTRPSPLWQQRQEANLARCVGLWRRHRSALALAGSAAAIAHGLWVTEPEPDLLLLTRTHPSRATIWLPGIVYEDPRTRQSVPGRARIRVRKRRHVLPEADLEVIGDVVVTSVMRTAVDCAFDLPARRSLPIIDSAVRALVRPRRFQEETAARRWEPVRAELLDRVVAEGRRPGAARARAVASLATPFAESPGESMLRWQVHALGLPAPSVQHRVELDQTYFLDVALPGVSVDLEYDGRGKYASPEDAWEEKLRQDALTRAGWHVGRFTGRHLADPALLAHDVLSLMPRSVAARARPVTVLC